MIRRGDVHFVDLEPGLGREQFGRRPVLVVSADEINQLPLVLTVVIGTRARNVERDYAMNVRVPRKVSGLPDDTDFLCFQIRSLDRARLVDPTTGNLRPAARLPPHWMAQVTRRLRRVLDA